MPSTNRYAVTARVGKNEDVFPDILRLYVPEGSTILDMTYGNGNFWNDVDESKYYIGKNDIDPARGKMHHDFQNLPEDWTSQWDAVVLDPPYMYVGGFKTLKYSVDSAYSNKERALKQGIHGVEAVDQMYFRGIDEAYRVLKPKGILILKCMDQVMSGKQVWAHITYFSYAVSHKLTAEDLFVLVTVSPIMRWKPEQQKHARRNHSYFLVFRKEDK